MPFPGFFAHGIVPPSGGCGTHDGWDGYLGDLGDLGAQTVTIAEALRPAGYGTYRSGKWHVTRHLEGPEQNWPCQRGFDDFYGIFTGASDYFNPSTLTRNNERIATPSGPCFITGAISDEAIRQIRSHVTASPDRLFFVCSIYSAALAVTCPPN